jgi:hypothetical protein
MITCSISFWKNFQIVLGRWIAIFGGKHCRNFISGRQIKSIFALVRNIRLFRKQEHSYFKGCKEILKKYVQGASKAVYNIYTGDELWIYAYEPETKQQSTVWVYQDEPNPTKVVRGRSTSKQMVTCFFGITGHVATVALEQRRTINSEWYATICLPEVIQKFEKSRRGESFFSMTMRTFTHRLKQRNF